MSILPLPPFTDMNAIQDSDTDAARRHAGLPVPQNDGALELALTREQEAELGSLRVAPFAAPGHRLFVARIRSRVHGELLELALQRLVERHPALRTTFHVEDERPVRRLHRSLEFQLTFVDASRWGDRELHEIVRLTAEQPIELSESVLRVVLFTRSRDDHVLLLAVHALAADAAGMRRLLEDLRALYAGDALPPEASDGDADPTASFGPDRMRIRISGRKSGPPRAIAAPAVQRLFEDQAALAPHHVAVTAGDTRLTYAEIDEAANRLARHLRANGVDARACVAVDLPLSPAAVISHLAILKAGAACVPLAALGLRGVAVALRAARTTALITRTSPRPTLAGAPPVVVDLDADAATIAATSAQPLGVHARPGNVAVVGFRRQGSRTLGVPLTHAAISNLVGSLRARPGLGAADRVLAPGPLDAKRLLLDVLLPLSSGAEVVLPGPEEIPDAAWIARMLSGDVITALYASGVRWWELLETGWEGATRLRALCDASDVVPGLAGPLAGRVGELWSLYGHLETSACCALAPVLGDERLPLVGDPIANSQLHLLDERLQPAGEGTAGALFVGGAPIARGYLGQAEAIDERFFPDPFSPDGRGLLFRTGDRAIRHPDGSLQLLFPHRDG